MLTHPLAFAGGNHPCFAHQYAETHGGLDADPYLAHGWLIKKPSGVYRATYPFGWPSLIQSLNHWKSLPGRYFTTAPFLLSPNHLGHMIGVWTGSIRGALSFFPGTVCSVWAIQFPRQQVDFAAKNQACSTSAQQ